ncbi:MAG: hypothetical protein WBL74_12335 [Novosphingobium sp.]|uniref:COG3650 family protein n=1 Tax=Novosphingobium sp. TaxID=1874826 RepID=UPI003C7E1D26
MRKALILGLAVLLAGCEKATPPDAVVAVSPSETGLPVPPPKPAVTAKPENTRPATTTLHLRAFGTEPFWAIDIAPGQLRYSSPELQDGKAFAASSSPEGKGVRYSGTLDGKAISLLIEPGTCSDGMSDTVHKWTAALTIDGKTEQGCARQL